MKLFSYGKDGGEESTVWGYWLVEIKSLFSVALLCFEDGSREAYHNHAFNCISWVLKGKLKEDIIQIDNDDEFHTYKVYKPAIFPIRTYKNTFHKVSSSGRTWVFTIRGPWNKEWNEYLPEEQRIITLKSGRKIVNEQKCKDI